MINIDEIEREIRELEARGDTTYSLCERLAWLYIVRDHLLPKYEDDSVTQDMRGSEFLEATSIVSYPALMQILNEHMEAVRVVQPKEYEAVMSRIRDLH